ncbi:hypothetical protein BDQ17DRAFT_1432013 [Cyathus striatus]|nr:hypothetical protein BDQ17DRAFT_1432013 [Cyathus striatus]
MLVNDPSHETITPLLLSGICTSWREVTHASPTLWRTINVVLSGSLEDEHTQVIFELAQQWLERAGKCPLNIRISIKRGSQLDEAFWANHKLPTLNEFLALFASREKQWVTLHTPLSEETTSALSGLLESEDTCPLPNLKLVTFDGINQTLCNWPDPIRLPSTITSLVVKQYMNVSIPLRALLPQWSDLTKLAWDVPVRVECIQSILAWCTSATHIEFGEVYIDEVGSAPMLTDYIPLSPVTFDELTLPKLKSLKLRFHEGSAIRHEVLSSLEGILTRFTMPSLHTLNVDAGCVAYIPFDALAKFVENSKCLLLNLSLTGIRKQRFTGGCEKDLIASLEKLKTVEELSLGSLDSFKLGVFWNALNEKSTTEFLPRIKMLQVTGSSRATNQVLLPILQSRQNVKHPVNHLEVIKLIVNPALQSKNNRKHVDSDINEEILSLTKDGDVVSSIDKQA